MTVAISAAAVLACSLCLDAQIQATLHPLGDGSTEIGIGNAGAVSVTAFAIRANDVNGVMEGPLIVYSDSAIDPGAAPVLPNQEGRIEGRRRAVMRNGKRTHSIFEQPMVTAGIFADGTTTGDASLLAGLILRRCNMVQAVELALEMLSDAAATTCPEID